MFYLKVLSLGFHINMLSAYSINCLSVQFITMLNSVGGKALLSLTPVNVWKLSYYFAIYDCAVFTFDVHVRSLLDAFSLCNVLQILCQFILSYDFTRSVEVKQM